MEDNLVKIAYKICDEISVIFIDKYHVVYLNMSTHDKVLFHGLIANGCINDLNMFFIENNLHEMSEILNNKIKELK